MNPTTKLPEITLHNSFGDPVQAYLLHGDRSWGIGYVGGEAVCIAGGEFQPGTKRAEFWQWDDRAGRYFQVDSGGIWREITPGFSAGSGAKLY